MLYLPFIWYETFFIDNFLLSQVLDALSAIKHTGGGTSIASGVNLAVHEFETRGKIHARLINTIKFLFKLLGIYLPEYGSDKNSIFSENSER